jgi:hypothetical protein
MLWLLRGGAGRRLAAAAIPPCRLTRRGLYAAYFLTWLASWDVGAAGRGGYIHMLSGRPILKE